MTDTPTLFRKVLIANRGEIAVHHPGLPRAGPETVAVYSDVDRNAMQCLLRDRGV